MWSHKFKLLLWKNWILVKRHPIAAIFELIFPILIVLLFSYIRELAEIKKHPPIHYQSFEPYSKECRVGYMFLSQNIRKLGFSPHHEFYENIVSSAIGTKFEVFGLEDEEKLNQWIRNVSVNEPVAAVNFETLESQHIVCGTINYISNEFFYIIDGQNTTDPRHLAYTIRLPQEATVDNWLTDQLFYVSPSRNARMQGESIPNVPPYYGSCFLDIQNRIDQAFIKKLKSDVQLPSLVLNAFPYPEVVEDLFLTFASALFPLLLVLCMLLPVKNVIKNIAVERETQLKESMKMMGLTNEIHWISWFTKCFIMLIIPFTINCILMTTSIVTNQAMFMKTNPLIMWIFLVIYIISVITLCFFIGVIFKKSSTAANVGSFIFFLTILPHSYFGDKFHSFPYILKMIFALIPNTNMGTAMAMLMNAEANRDGIHFMNLFKRDLDLKFSFGELLVYMILGSIIQMFLTIYIEKVFPGEIGISEPFYYPLIPVIKYLKRKIGYDTLSNESVLTDRKLSNPDYEEDPENLRAGVRIVNLSKKFGDKFVVDKLCLNLYENQISVLLGHNGAGKTTTMNMLTGLYSPSGGTAFVDGKDIRTELDEARKSLGICCQHNVLFEELTVKEHLIFFCSLKGIDNKRLVEQEIQKYGEILGLNEKLHAQSKTLSGGMKRRLSTAIALCGNSKIIILDEPTSGMDPEARRKLWDLLIEEKKGRTILLSTHFMDEADILGDRIAIMTDGRLRTVGSSFFLKKKFGAGYRLICVKKFGFQSIEILNVLNQYAPETCLESETQTEATFIINEDRLPLFEQIFKVLEDNSEELRISSFGCNLTTLEEVFLKLGIESHGNELDEADGRQDNIDMNAEMSVKVTGFQLVMYQIQAILLKRFHVFRRAWKSLIYIALISIWMIVVVMSVPQINFNDIHKLKISLESYEETKTVIQNSGSDLFETYKSLLTGKDHSEVTNSNFSDYILEKSNNSFSDVMQKYLVGVTLSPNAVIAWFNSQPFHTLPLTISLINRAILKNLIGDEYDLTVSNKPYVMPIKDSESHMAIFEDPRNIIFALVTIFFLLTYWPVIFIGSYVKERESRAKLLLYISGANRFIYWITSLIFDYIIFMIISFFIIAMIGVYQRDHYATFEELGTLLIICGFYGFSMLPFIYAFSYLFTKHSSGETYLSLVSLLLGVFFGVQSLLEQTVENAMFKSIIRISYWIGLFLPPFSLTDELVKLGYSFLSHKSIFTFDPDTGIGRNILLHILSGVLFLGFCLLKDHLIFEWIYYRFLNRPRMLPLLNDNLDSDVNEEIQKVKEMSLDQIKNSNLVLKGVSKYYGNLLAVNQLYLDVERCECFGLLGINGAGKTSTFKMMTGDELITAGDAYIRGYSMKDQLQKVHQLIGYTPQYDALIPELTGMETLKIFSLIRGIPKYEINGNITSMSRELDFEQHLMKQIKTFSGGNKRKISTCLALLAYPELIFLDEPTTGIDPQAKRQLWDVINKTRNSGRAIVITSHSMEECENLCTKIGIMVNGQFKCLGSVQYLKNKYSKGFVLTIKMGKDDTDLQIDIQNRVLEAFPSAELKEKYLDILTFHIDNTNLQWSQVFGICAQMKESVNISDYSLCQMSLEQVFLLFSKSGIYQNV